MACAQQPTNGTLAGCCLSTKFQPTHALQSTEGEYVAAVLYPGSLASEAALSMAKLETVRAGDRTRGATEHAVDIIQLATADQRQRTAQP